MDAGCSVSGWGVVAQRGMSSAVVVFGLPVTDYDSGLGEGPEAVDVEAFVAQATVEGFDVAVAPGLTGWDERQTDSLAGPVDWAPVAGPPIMRVAVVG